MFDQEKKAIYSAKKLEDIAQHIQGLYKDQKIYVALLHVRKKGEHLSLEGILSPDVQLKELGQYLPKCYTLAGGKHIEISAEKRHQRDLLEMMFFPHAQISETQISETQISEKGKVILPYSVYVCFLLAPPQFRELWTARLRALCKQASLVTEPRSLDLEAVQRAFQGLSLRKYEPRDRKNEPYYFLIVETYEQVLLAQRSFAPIPLTVVEHTYPEGKRFIVQIKAGMLHTFLALPEDVKKATFIALKEAKLTKAGLNQESQKKPKLT